jgi:hypothetical protein
MPDLKETINGLIGLGSEINTKVTKGVDLPLGTHGDKLTFSLPNWEDPKIKLSLPSKDWRKPNVSFSAQLDLGWHQPIKDYGMSLLDSAIAKLKR